MSLPPTLPRDPVMLMSWVNMKLRDEALTPDELCRTYDISREELDATLAAAGFEYLPQANAYR